MLTAAIVLALAVPSEADAPAVVASGPAFTVLAVRRRPAAPSVERAENEAGTAIIYVPLKDGRARTLIQSGNRETAAPPAAGGVERPPTVTQTRIVSATADEARLYVLVWHGEWFLRGPGEFVGPVLGNSEDYRLYAFRLTDGSALAPVRVKGGPKTVPEESTRAGHLRAVPGGVKAFDETIPFGGKGK